MNTNTAPRHNDIEELRKDVAFYMEKARIFSNAFEEAAALGSWSNMKADTLRAKLAQLEKTTRDQVRELIRLA